MPARDSLYDTVKAALIEDGWTITHDPFKLPFGDRSLYADLGAERALGAEKGDSKIAVEIKSFIGASEMHDLQQALGQYVLYRFVLRGFEPSRQLFVALPEEAYNSVLGDTAGMDLIKDVGLRLFTVESSTQKIVRWLK